MRRASLDDDAQLALRALTRSGTGWRYRPEPLGRITRLVGARWATRCWSRSLHPSGPNRRRRARQRRGRVELPLRLVLPASLV